MDFEGRLDGLSMSGSLREGSGGGGRGGMPPDELSACKAALKDISKHKDAGAFLDPVDWKALDIPDYPTIIKRPMDLGTVMQRLQANEYASVADMADEVSLVWNNAMTYNMDDSWIYQSAVRGAPPQGGRWGLWAHARAARRARVPTRRRAPRCRKRSSRLPTRSWRP